MKVREVLCTTYAADGRRLRGYSQESIQRLETLKLVVVQRNRHGQVVSAHFYGQSRQPLQARLKAGTRYSFREHVGDIGRTWALEPLPWKAVDAQLGHMAQPEVIDSHVRALFQAVGLSCATGMHAPGRTAKVISIDAGRKARRKNASIKSEMPIAA